MTDSPVQTRGENAMIRALYLIAILFVVDGHTPFKDMFDWGGLFGYYSRQVSARPVPEDVEAA